MRQRAKKLGKNLEKARDARDTRIAAMPNERGFHKPGSLNRKKGWRRKSYRKV